MCRTKNGGGIVCACRRANRLGGSLAVRLNKGYRVTQGTIYRPYSAHNTPIGYHHRPAILWSTMYVYDDHRLEHNPTTWSMPTPPPHPTQCREKALQLMSALKASKLVTMANANGDFSGPLGNVVSAGEPLEVFLGLAKSENFAVVVPEVGKPVSVWP